MTRIISKGRRITTEESGAKMFHHYLSHTGCAESNCWINPDIENKHLDALRKVGGKH